MSAISDTIDDARLINAVKNNPVVFDRKHVYYSSMSRKEIAWRSIATICDSTANVIKKRWKAIRDKYVRELKNINDKIEEGLPPRIPTWEHFTTLSFIRAHIRLNGSGEMNYEESMVEPSNEDEESLVHSSANLNTLMVSPKFMVDDTTNQMNTSTYEDIDNNPLSEFIVLKSDFNPVSKVDVDLIALISAIRVRPLLYDRNNTLYSNSRTRDTAWLEVATDCQCTTQLAKSKWKFLRTKYINESKSKTPSKWPCWEQMHFIKDHLNSAVIRASSNDGGGGDGLDVGSSNESELSSKIDMHGDDTAIDDARLIGLVKENYILYDRSHELYNNLARKDEVWLALANVLHSRVPVLKSRWKYLRDRFVRVSRYGSVDKNLWPLYEEMYYLRDHVRYSKKDDRDSPSSRKRRKSVCTIEIEQHMQHEHVPNNNTITATSTTTSSSSSVNNGVHPMPCLVLSDQYNDAENFFNGNSVTVDYVNSTGDVDSSHERIQQIKIEEMQLIDLLGKDSMQQVPMDLQGQMHNMATVPDDYQNGGNIGAGDDGNGGVDGDSAIDDPLEAKIKSIWHRIQNEDEEESFGRFIAQKMRSFPKKQRSEAKTHIFGFLMAMENTIE